MPKYVMLIEAGKCLNCKACVLACQQRNGVPFSMARNWVREAEVNGSPVYQPGGCMHCDNAQCVLACPTAATYKADDGRVLVDKARCIACGACMRACPYGARYIHPTQHVVDKCDFCGTDLEQGLEPACVSVCTTRVRVFGNKDDLESPISKIMADSRQTLVPVEPEKTPMRPNLLYVGTVHDKHWPKAETSACTPSALLGFAATAVRWVGGLSLAGVVAMLVKDRFVRPSGSNDTNHKGEDA